MSRNRKKIKKDQLVQSPRDKQAERTVYTILILLMIIGITVGYMMITDLADTALPENDQDNKIEKAE